MSPTAGSASCAKAWRDRSIARSRSVPTRHWQKPVIRTATQRAVPLSKAQTSADSGSCPGFHQGTAAWSPRASNHDAIPDAIEPCDVKLFGHRAHDFGARVLELGLKILDLRVLCERQQL